MNKTKQFEALYAQVPSIPGCKGLCHDSCGPVLASKWEAERISKSAVVLERKDAEVCPFLTEDNSCSSYQHRPLVCRLYGTAEGFLCEHGCEVEHVIPDKQAREMLRRSLEIGGETTPIAVYVDRVAEKARVTMEMALEMKRRN
jgi:Fe-S-cluster containining protein